MNKMLSTYESHPRGNRRPLFAALLVAWFPLAAEAVDPVPPGAGSILQQVQLARRRGVPWLYLGFWIDGLPKMDYKRRFRPLQLRGSHGWEPMP